MRKVEKESWTLFILMCACLVVGIWVGIMVGESAESRRIVIDQDHLIFDSVLYKQVVPPE